MLSGFSRYKKCISNSTYLHVLVFINCIPLWGAAAETDGEDEAGGAAGAAAGAAEEEEEPGTRAISQRSAI